MKFERRFVPALSVLVGLMAFAAWFVLPSTTQRLIQLTGEESKGSQLRALWNLLLEQARPPLQLARNAKINYYDGLTGAPGVNTFLHQEVEPSKRERQVQMIADAGFKWIRQPFPWYDIEVSAKGNFSDTRNGLDAWAKYDNIVDLAAQHDLKIIARLEAPPEWAHQGYKDLGTLGPPADRNDFADFVGTTVAHYKGRIRYYQIWNEPNIYPEWGEQRSNPEDYTKMLCAAYARAKQVDPNVVIIAAALAPTISQDGGGFAGGGLNDLIFLQRMYKAGASKCFDVAAAQGYGLFSGPWDGRQNPLQTNVARHVLMRDIMVRNGDETKPIWLAEVNWNALPPNAAGISDYGRYGISTTEEQARYVPQVYERAKQEWPWVGVIAVWYFKDASDEKKNTAPYYFRMVEPDFTPLPIYEAMKKFLRAGNTVQ
jgi:polysaccharide biosynthesis protein PslG